MPVVSNQYTINPLNPDPDFQTTGTLDSIYKQRPKSFFLANMIRELKQSGKKLYRFDEGSVPHRFLDAIAHELARIDRSWFDSIERAIKESVYSAFTQPGEFSARYGATFAAGYGRFVRGTPATVREIIPAGTIVATLDGLTAVTTAPCNIEVGANQVVVLVRAELAGAGGNAPAGTFKRVLSSVGSYTFTNITALDGGQDSETNSEIAARFFNYISFLGTANAGSISSAAFNAYITSGLNTIRARDIAIVQPWRVPDLAIPPGLFYVVAEEGGGTCSPALLTAIDTNVQPKVAGGNRGIVFACAATVVAPVLSYQYYAGASVADIDNTIIQAFSSFMSQTLIEDGSGRGAIDFTTLATALKESHPDVVGLQISFPESNIFYPPVATRAVSGIITFTRTAV